MQFTINQAKALDLGLNSQQALLFAFLHECPNWKGVQTIDFRIFAGGAE
ncbi:MULTISPECIES: hypothetical protein [Pseudomonas]|nr:MULTISPECIES: hypothetical protein [Pseudomonas]